MPDQSAGACGGTVNGQTAMNIEGPVTMTAIADAPAVSAWKVNGTVVEGETDIFLVFTADGNTVVEAVNIRAPCLPALPVPTAA